MRHSRRRSAAGLGLLAALGLALVVAVWNAADPGGDLGDTMQATTVPTADVSAGPPGASSTSGPAATSGSSPPAAPAAPPPAPSTGTSGQWPAPIPTASTTATAPRATPAPAAAPATTVAAQSPPAPPATDPPPTAAPATTTTAAPTTTSLVLVGEACDLAGQLGLSLGAVNCVCTRGPDGVLRWAPTG